MNDQIGYVAGEGSVLVPNATAITTFPDSQTMREASGLNWTVGRSQVWAAHKPVPGKTALIRNDTGACLGIVSDTFQSDDPQAIFNLGDRISGVSDARWSTAGMIHRGKSSFPTIWGSMWCDSIEIADQPHASFVFFSTTFDGTMSLVISALSVRVICSNTLAAALASGNSNGIRIRHTAKDRQSQIDAAVAIYQDADQQTRRFAEWCEELARHQIDERLTYAVENAIAGPPITADVAAYTDRDKRERAKRKRDQTIRNFHDRYLAPEIDLGGMTALSLFHAATGLADHGSRYKRMPNMESAGEARLYGTMFGSAAAMKTRVANRLTELVS